MALEALAKEHLANLQHAASIAQQAYESKQLPSLSAIPEEVVHTLLITTCVVTGCTIMLVPRTRKLILETLEAILTIILLILLIGVVLGMPIGVTYMSYRGLAFLCTSLLSNFPALQGLIAPAQATLASWLRAANRTQQQEQAQPRTMEL